jgi:hypothetical protein
MTSIRIDEALADERVLGATLGDLGSWSTWICAVKAAFGLELTANELDVFKSIAGDRPPPQKRVRHLYAIVGRRAGKSRMAAVMAVFLACCVDHTGKLAPGEVGYVLCLSPTLRQSQLVFSYMRAILEASPVLARHIDQITADEIRLRGNITIAAIPANYRTLRGRTVLAAVLDESAQFRDETSAMPDIEIARSLTPAMATTGGMTIGISSPFAERGLLWERFRDFYGKDDQDTLVIKGGSRDFNPLLSEEAIAKELQSDPDGARAEWLGEFRANLTAYIDRASLDYCVDRDVHERPFSRRLRFHCFVDPGGGRHDAFAAAFGHAEGERMILDRLFEWQAPYSPADCVDELAGYLKAYSIKTVTGDAYAAGWVENEFKSHGIGYVKADKDKSSIYLSALPMLTSGTARILDDKRLFDQMINLNRECGKGGRDMIVKQRGSYDDRANAACGALVYCQVRGKRPVGHRPLSVEGCASYNAHSMAREDRGGGVNR